MRDLAACVHASIGPSGHGQRGRLRGPQNAPERDLDLFLDRPHAVLGGPAMEQRAVIPEVDPEPDDPVAGTCGDGLAGPRLDDTGAGLVASAGA